MEELLQTMAYHVGLVLDTVAIIVIVIGSIEVLFSMFRAMLMRATTSEKREVWLRYARWLVAGLTFQLAGDIVETALVPSWEPIGHLAAIAVIRTFLSFFLEREMQALQAGREPAHQNSQRLTNAHKVVRHVSEVQ
jgi:uncharacterized membrane protein